MDRRHREVTNAQYAAFLNAVAASGTFGLYNSQMTDDTTHGGIDRQGTVVYSYSAKIGMESRPVNYVSYWDALRFSNWLHNAQPSGGQGVTTTEDGAYTLTSGAIAANSVTRNEDALYGVTNDDEWYKAAYCGFVGETTDVGSYPGAASPGGTFDQGGNVREWTGAASGSYRTLRGGAYNSGAAQLASTVRWSVLPTSEVPELGFRVVFVGIEPLPVPALGTVATGVLLTLLAALGARGLRARSS
ncbi:MAG: SUMF1/EgtB/PvdO family nonheme iron enzyme [Myxococcota bacterium]|nr:SUMF1/EgtB/PvdO family nonheme iron enzyme [Myxococcota bacterium]